jgi:mono/diheme cytochrome c family protein
MRLILTSLVFVLFFIGRTWGQPGVPNAEDVQKGHELAIHICAICHVAAPDQPNQPIMKPPAPSFASIVRQKTFDAESLTRFMKTTHWGLDNPLGMPNPELMDYQIKQIVAYFLSLYK